MSSDLWSITCYFNPCRYRTKRANFDVFMEGMKKSGANLLVVELAFGDEEFELEPGENVLQLRGGGVMWQKERLLNIAVERLPADCTKVAWLDNDLIFDDPRWLERTSRALDDFMVVQPFSSCIRMVRGTDSYDGGGETYESFGHCFTRVPAQARGSDFAYHGHTGFAWAARRELLEEVGLYDPCLTGSGDHLMSHGFSGGMRRSPCMKRVIGNQAAYMRHYLRWADKTRELVQGRLGYIPGTLLHLWHGDLGRPPLHRHEQPVHDLRFRSRQAFGARREQAVRVERRSAEAAAGLGRQILLDPPRGRHRGRPENPDGGVSLA